MTGVLTTTERLIGGALIGWGLLMLFITFRGMMELWEFRARYYDGLTLDNISLVSVIANYRYKILLPVLTIYSGTMILMKRRIGWLTSLLVSFLNGTGLILAYYGLTKTSTPTELFYLILVICTALIFFAIFLIVLGRIYKEKYKASTWTTIIVILTILFFDSLLTYDI